MCWAATYIGYLDKVKIDQNSVSTSAEIAKLAQSIGIGVQLSGAYSTNALGAVERYHVLLGPIFLSTIEYIKE